MSKKSKLLEASERLAQYDSHQSQIPKRVVDEPFLIPLEDIAQQLEEDHAKKQKKFRILGICVLGASALLVSGMSYLKQQRNAQAYSQTVSTILESKNSLLKTFQPSQGFLFTKTNIEHLLSNGIDPKLPLASGQLQVQALPTFNGFTLTIPSASSDLCHYVTEQLQADFYSISVDQTVVSDTNRHNVCQQKNTLYAISFIHFDPSITFATPKVNKNNSVNTAQRTAPSETNQPLVPLRPPIEPGFNGPADVQPDYGANQPKPIPAPTGSSNSSTSLEGLKPPRPDAQLVLLPDA